MAKLVAEKADVIPQLAEIFREHGYAATRLSTIKNGSWEGQPLSLLSRWES
jgi:hypothetical protein